MRKKLASWCWAWERGLRSWNRSRCFRTCGSRSQIYTSDLATARLGQTPLRKLCARTIRHKPEAVASVAGLVLVNALVVTDRLLTRSRLFVTNLAILGSDYFRVADNWCLNLEFHAKIAE